MDEKERILKFHRDMFEWSKSVESWADETFEGTRPWQNLATRVQYAMQQYRKQANKVLPPKEPCKACGGIGRGKMVNRTFVAMAQGYMLCPVCIPTHPKQLEAENLISLEDVRDLMSRAAKQCWKDTFNGPWDKTGIPPDIEKSIEASVDKVIEEEYSQVGSLSSLVPNPEEYPDG